MSLMNKKIVVFDLETTGLDPASDKIIEVGLVRLEEGKITETYHSLLNPGKAVPLRVKRLTGIDDRDLENAPCLAEILPEVVAFIGDAALAGHNVWFDMAFLTAACGTRFENSLYDTLDLARLLVPGALSYRLETLCEELNIELKAKHRALEDAVAAARVLQVLTERLRTLDFKVLTLLNGLLGEARSGWHGLTGGLLKECAKKFPDRKITGECYWRRSEEKAGKKEAVLSGGDGGNERTVPDELDENTAGSYVAIDGPLPSALPGFKYRRQQEAMVREVVKALNEEKYLVMEAGTGVGKSIAYLIPFILWSLSKKERVVVATHTINLQEQLLNKDIPILREVIKQPFKAVLVKGRQNYICLRRWFAALESPHSPEEAAFFARILVWLTETGTGDKSELNILPAEEDYWLAVCGEADGCLGSRCRFRRDCFVNKARRESEEADLIIINHSFLLSDVASDSQLLPEYGPLLLDEAHHFEDSATKHLGRQLSQNSVGRWLGIVGKSLSKLAEKAPPGDRMKWSQNIKAALETRLETVEALRLFSMQVMELMIGGRNGESEYNRVSVRLPVDGRQYESFLECGRKCMKLIGRLSAEISRCAEMMELWSLTDEWWIGPCRDLQQLAKSGAEMEDDFGFVLQCHDTDFVHWAEVELANRGSAKNSTIYAAPIDVGALLYEKLYKKKSVVIMTSATLAVNGSFDYFVESSGLKYLGGKKIKCINFDSPFMFDKQALLCVNRGLPVQGEVPDEIYLQQLEEAIYKIIEATGGGTLVLFTSHRTLQEIYKRLKPKLESMGIMLLGHGMDGSRSKILEDFKKAERAVLFGAYSFWEGIDVPGKALICVVMVKLPFMSPAVPVYEARLENLARQNRDGFRTLTVPKAVIRFKQGFGRLIRSDDDRGCVIILDGRILSKNYGRQFLNSLPVSRHFRGSSDIISRKIKEWFVAEDKK